MDPLSLKKPLRDIFFEPVFVIALAICSYYFYKLKLSQCDTFGPQMFIRVAEYSGEKPWQYRILIPFLANTLSGLKLPLLDSAVRISKLIEIISIFLLVLSFRYYLSFFMKDKIVNSILSFLIFFILPFHLFFPRPYYPYYWYDTPSILFFTIGMIFLYQERWGWYYTLFIVATLNRETTCLLTLIYLFTALGKEKMRKIALHCTIQLVIWMVIKSILFRMYLGNPGPNGLEWYDRPGVTHFSDNLQFFMNPENYPLFFSMFGFVWIPVLSFHSLIKDDFVKKSLLAIFPLFFGMMFVANIYELRIFGEMIPAFLTAFIVILNELFLLKKIT